MDESARNGLVSVIPVVLLLLVGFALPLLFIVYTGFMPSRSFGLIGEPTLENYWVIVADGYWRPLMWSLAFAAATTVLSVVIAWPIAKALVVHAGRFASIISILVAVPVFIAESVRLFGAHLFMMPKGGILAGSMNALFGIDVGSILFTPFATLVGMVYIYLPFAIFPMVLGLSQVPREQVEAAKDLGASGWQTVTNVELPIALPGILIGGLLVFVLALGATAEAAILGGQSVVVAVQSIEQRFNYAQDWPLGSALATVLCVITALVVFPSMRRLDVDRLFRR
jgi:spermidine/putrescine transport system permease protein